MKNFSSKEKNQTTKQYLDCSEIGEGIAKSIGASPVLPCEWIRRYE